MPDTDVGDGFGVDDGVGDGVGDDEGGGVGEGLGVGAPLFDRTDGKKIEKFALARSAWLARLAGLACEGAPCIDANSAGADSAGAVCAHVWLAALPLTTAIVEIVLNTMVKAPDNILFMIEASIDKIMKWVEGSLKTPSTQSEWR